MTKLKKYSTLSDWETAKGGGDLEYPSVGLIEEDSSVVYMEKPFPRLLELPIKAVFYDSATGKFVKLYPDQITEVNPNYTPIGVEVVPAEHDVYGTGQAGIMSLVEMSCTNPDYGSIDENGNAVYQPMLEGCKNNRPLENEGFYFYSTVNYIGGTSKDNDNVVQGTYYEVYLPSDIFEGNLSPDQHSRYYEISGGYAAPSPFNLDSTRNESYYTKSYSDRNALSDFDGVGNTDIATQQHAYRQPNWQTDSEIVSGIDYKYYAAACCCRRFSTAGTTQFQ